MASSTRAGWGPHVRRVLAAASVWMKPLTWQRNAPVVRTGPQGMPADFVGIDREVSKSRLAVTDEAACNLPGAVQYSKELRRGRRKANAISSHQSLNAWKRRQMRPPSINCQTQSAGTPSARSRPRFMSDNANAVPGLIP